MVEILKEYVTMSVDDIIPYDNNPRNNDEAVYDVAESIRQVGYISPIVVDEDGVVLCGHTRLKALRLRKINEFEVLVVSGLSEAQKKKYRLLDNKTNEKADWDLEKLRIELEGLDFQGFDFGFEISSEVDDYTEDVESESDAEEDAEVCCPYCKQWFKYNPKKKS